MQTNRSNKVSVLLACVKERKRIFQLLYVGYPYSWQATEKYVYLQSEKHLNSCDSSVGLKRMIYLNVEIKTDLMGLLLVGGFAFVYEAQDLGSGKDYALKVK